MSMNIIQVLLMSFIVGFFLTFTDVLSFYVTSASISTSPSKQKAASELMTLSGWKVEQNEKEVQLL